MRTATAAYRQASSREDRGVYVLARCGCSCMAWHTTLRIVIRSERCATHFGMRATGPVEGVPISPAMVGCSMPPTTHIHFLFHHLRAWPAIETRAIWGCSGCVARVVGKSPCNPITPPSRTNCTVQLAHEALPIIPQVQSCYSRPSLWSSLSARDYCLLGLPALSLSIVPPYSSRCALSEAIRVRR